MNREEVFEAIADIDDRLIAESNNYAPEATSASLEKIVHINKKRIITFALAATLILSLGIAAYAAIFSMSRRVPEMRETFRINYKESPEGYIEWCNTKLVITFPEKAKSKEMEFSPTWLPKEMDTLKNDSKGMRSLKKDSDWFCYFTAESLTFADSPDFVSVYKDMSQPLLISTCSMSQFNNGGALLLLYNTPGEIFEERWDELGVDVMRVHCTQRVNGRTIEQDMILLSNAEEGWIIRVCGQIGMDELIKVAKNLNIRKTGKVFTYNDFENHYSFIDAGIG